MARNRNNRKLQIVPDQSDATPVDAGQEYVAASGVSFAQRGTVLPSQPREECLDPDVYRRMLHDPEVAKDVWLLVNGTLADGVSLHPAELPDGDPREGLAQEYFEFHSRNLQELSRPIEDTLEKLLKDAIQYGHKIAEQTWEIAESGPDAGLARIKSLKVKSRKSIQFVVDRFFNVLGLQPAQSYGLPTSIIPRSKFVVLSLREEDEDPRGNSWLRASVNGWQFKQNTWPVFHRFNQRVAIPSLVGKTAPGTGKNFVAVVDDNGAPVLVNGKPKRISEQEHLLLQLIKFENSLVVTVPNGAEVDVIEAAHEGALFERTIDISNTEITNGILYQTRATNEAQHGSRADSQTAMSILEQLIWYLKGKLAWMVVNDILKPIHIFNFGEENLDLMPSVSLGDSERKDWASDAHAAVELGPFVTDSQWNGLTMQLGIEPPEEGEALPERGKSQSSIIPTQDNLPTNQPPNNPEGNQQ